MFLNLGLTSLKTVMQLSVKWHHTCWTIATLLAQRCTATIKDLKLLSPATAAASACTSLEFYYHLFLIKI